MTLNECLQGAQAQGVSDLHLSEGQPLRARWQGGLQVWPPQAPLMLDSDLMVNWLSALFEGAVDQGAPSAANDAMATAPKPKATLRQDWLSWLSQGERDASHSVGDVRVRINAFVHSRGLGASLRLIPHHLPSWQALGIPNVAQAWLQEASGLILVTGATGSGKSTTLAALVDHLNEQAQLHLITLEDPIEFVHTPKNSLIHQRQLHRDFAHFASGLKSALRQDPDVILVGELRDLDTIRLALQAAETGHLVLASLHTRSAPQTIERIVDAFGAEEKPWVRNQLSLSLSAVICQHLVARRDGQGRLAAHEVMVATPAVRHLIREGKTAQIHTALQTGASVGMQTLQQALDGLKARGLIAL